MVRRSLPNTPKENCEASIHKWSPVEAGCEWLRLVLGDRGIAVNIYRPVLSSIVRDQEETASELKQPPLELDWFNQSSLRRHGAGQFAAYPFFRDAGIGKQSMRIELKSDTARHVDIRDSRISLRRECDGHHGKCSANWLS